jgi:Ca-activated chloride channel family protein
MGIMGTKSLKTRTNRSRAALAAMLVLGLLAVSCTSGDGDEAATDTAAAYDASPDEATSEPAPAQEAAADVGGDRNSSGSAEMAAPTTTSHSRTYVEEPMAEEEPTAEAAADYEYADSAPSPTITAAAATSGVSRAEAAASDREPSEARRRCSECQANTFEDYGVNPFVDTYEDDLSTFALDVDTASYVVTRNFLEGGRLPPIEAVRVEEFVNYFDGGYQTVIDEFNITLEAAPSPFSDPDRVMLRVGVQAPEVLSDLVIPDSVVLVLDRSGSMGEPAGPDNERMQRMTLVHESVEMLLNGLPGRTRVGVVAYNDRASVILEPTRVSGNQDWIIEEVSNRVRPGGSTNAEAGLVWGFDMALSEADRGGNVLVLLLSDGVANVGATRTDDILEEIGERGDIGLSTIGVGLGPFNDELMEQLANKADGTYHYIDTLEEAGRIFVENLNAMLASVARDAKIQVEFDRDKVISYRLLGFENRAIADEDFRDDTRDAGEVGVGQSSTALYEVTLDRGWDRSRGAIATATLRYRRPASERITETWASLHPDDVERSFTDADPHFRLAVVAAEFAEVLRDSPFVEDRSMEELGYQADRVADELRRDADAEELADLIDAARRIRRR